MNYRSISFCATLFLSLIALATSPAFAQTQGAQATPIQFFVTPETPGPGEQVKITLEGVGAFLGNSPVTWSVDGKQVLKGVGESSYVFTAGSLGTEQTVKVTVESGAQGTITKTFVIAPSAINLVWEADTTTPPFYRGRALYSGGSKVTVVAYPQININKKPVSAKALSYQWSLNDEPLQSSSGLGKNTLVFQGDQLKPREVVKLDVYAGSTKVGHQVAVINAVTPSLVFYQRNPLRGEIYEQALGSSVSFSGGELTVQAEPFFFSTTAKKNRVLSYTWAIDGTETSGPDAARGVMTFRRNGAGSGSATLQVNAQNTANDQIIQSADAIMQMVFGNTSTTF